MGKIYGRRAVDFAAEAIALALDDAGLTKNDIDGLLINANIPNDMDPRTQMALGFENLTLINVMNGYGSTAGSDDAICLHGDPRGPGEGCRPGLRGRAVDADSVHVSALDISGRGGRSMHRADDNDQRSISKAPE